MKWTMGVRRLFIALFISSLSSVFLYFLGVLYYHASIFWFLNWNLFLAWLPLFFAVWLAYYLKNHPWVSWGGVGITLMWLAFLPNSFYLISDLMHMNSIFTGNPLFFAVMIFSFSFNGLMLGFISLYIVHKHLLKRIKASTAHAWIGLILVLCSFAIYLGRYLRWSTWDIFLNPIGVVSDVSDRFINPVTYGQTFQVMLWFVVLLGSMYFVLWYLVDAIKSDKSI